MGRWVNDSKYYPNARMKKFIVANVPHLCLFAIKDIDIGEEIVYFYGVDNLPWHERVSTLC